MILGSGSPRRKEILGFFSLPFRQIPSQFDELSISFTGDPIHYATTLAEKKAGQLAGDFPSDIILTADTIVYFNHKVFNKPRDTEEALKFLKELSGQWHTVYTGVAVQKGEKIYSGFEATKILFHELSEKQMHSYLRFGNHLDKAGGYAIQNTGSLAIKQIDGCYYNAMGLPIHTVRSLLLNVDIDLWDYLRPF